MGMLIWAAVSFFVAVLSFISTPMVQLLIAGMLMACYLVLVGILSQLSRRTE